MTTVEVELVLTRTSPARLAQFSSGWPRPKDVTEVLANASGLMNPAACAAMLRGLADVLDPWVPRNHVGDWSEGRQP